MRKIISVYKGRTHTHLVWNTRWFGLGAVIMINTTQFFLHLEATLVFLHFNFAIHRDNIEYDE